VTALGGCATRTNPTIQNGAFGPQAALEAMQPIRSDAPNAIKYRIGPLDELKITVFREPDLSAEDLPVDVNGSISLPLLGQVQAIGLTAEELSKAITEKLNARYLRDAQVAVSITKPVNFSITVDGEVKKPGVYSIPGRVTLLQAIALGEGTTEFAKQDEVIVFRLIEGRRYVARFDLEEIRLAHATDPEIQQSDVVVVGFSRASKLTRDLITSLPGLASVFIALRQ
jgi:polysaccharide export outer membrane protein